MDPTARTTSLIVALVIAGVLMGTVIGSLGEPDAKVAVQTVVRTQTVSKTKTVTRTRTKTVTRPADGLADADALDEDDAATGTTDTGRNCSSDYLDACIPADSPEIVSCRDIPERDFQSVGNDPYALDPDGDGTACES